MRDGGVVRSVKRSCDKIVTAYVVKLHVERAFLWSRYFGIGIDDMAYGGLWEDADG